LALPGISVADHAVWRTGGTQPADAEAAIVIGKAVFHSAVASPPDAEQRTVIDVIEGLLHKHEAQRWGRNVNPGS